MRQRRCLVDGVTTRDCTNQRGIRARKTWPTTRKDHDRAQRAIV